MEYLVGDLVRPCRPPYLLPDSPISSQKHSLTHSLTLLAMPRPGMDAKAGDDGEPEEEACVGMGRSYYFACPAVVDNLLCGSDAGGK